MPQEPLVRRLVTESCGEPEIVELSRAQLVVVELNLEASHLERRLDRPTGDGNRYLYKSWSHEPADHGLGISRDLLLHELHGLPVCWQRRPRLAHEHHRPAHLVDEKMELLCLHDSQLLLYDDVEDLVDGHDLTLVG